MSKQPEGTFWGLGGPGSLPSFPFLGQGAPKGCALSRPGLQDSLGTAGLTVLFGPGPFIGRQGPGHRSLVFIRGAWSLGSLASYCHRSDSSCLIFNGCKWSPVGFSPGSSGKDVAAGTREVWQVLNPALLLPLGICLHPDSAEPQTQQITIREHFS